ncbi:MAG: hypothetical protein ACTS42_01515 [Candidatus Hodgkinia cicadicola]
MLTLKLKQLRRSLSERFGAEQSIGITQLRRVSLNEIRLLSISMSTSSRPLIILNLGRRGSPMNATSGRRTTEH